MLTFEEVGDILDEISEDMPEDFYKYLNGGVSLSPYEKLHPQAVANDLFILGEYHNEYSLGRYILIYYGSFLRVHGNLDRARAKQVLRKILLHEFTHHLESLSGERDLEIQDAIDIAQYRRKRSIE